MLQNTWQGSHVMVVVVEPGNPSLPKAILPSWETCKQDERKLEAIRNESFHTVASQDEATTQSPILSPWISSFNSTSSKLQPGKPLLICLEKLLVLMAFGAWGTSPWSILVLKHNPQIERASGPLLYIRTKIIMVIACILLDTFHSIMSSNLYASN